MTSPRVEDEAVVRLQRVLGRRIRRRRGELGWSLRDLAERTGVSASFLSQVERGQGSPSLATLQAIAEALAVPLVYFVMAAEQGEHVVRDGQGAHLRLPGSPIEYELRSPASARHMLVFVAHMQPGTTNRAIRPSISTQETIYVLRGRLEVVLEDERHVLAPGDSITFDGRRLLHLVNVDDTPTAYISFITPPPFPID